MESERLAAEDHLELLVSDFIDLEDVIDGLAASAWNRLSETPSGRALAPAYLPPMRMAVRVFLHARLIRVRPSPHGGRILAFRTPPGGAEAFAVDLAGRLVCTLEGALRDIRPLDLMTSVIPAAILGCLDPIRAPRWPAAAAAVPAVAPGNVPVNG